jgi:hypothetical protein
MAAVAQIQRMRLASILVALLLPATLAGCGVVYLETSDGPEPTPDPDPDPDPDPPDPPDPPPAEPAFCDTASLGVADQAVAARWDETSVLLLFWDGSTQAIEPWPEAPPAKVNGGVSIVSGGGLFAVNASWRTFDPDDGRAFITWYSRAGVVIDALEGGGLTSATMIGGDGTTLIYRYEPLAGPLGYAVRLPEGGIVELPGVDIDGAPLDDGWLVARSSNDPVELHFVEPRSGETAPIGPVPASTYPTRTRRGVAYLAAGELVEDTPAGRTTHALPGVDEAGVYIAGVSPSGHVLIASSERDAAWRLDTASGIVVAIDPRLPPGLRPLDDSCGLQRPLIASDGDVYRPLRDDHLAQFHVVDSDTEGSSALGEPIAAPGLLATAEKSGTYLLAGDEGSNTFCPIIDWQRPDPGALPHGALQVLRPADGTHHVLPAADIWNLQWLYALSEDGGCLAVPDLEGNYSFFDVTSGTSVLAPGSGGLTWLSF